MPEVDAVGARVFSSIYGMGCGYKCFKCLDTSDGNFLGEVKSKVKRSGTWFYKNKGFQFLKIYISSFQILGSFGMFAIEWPVAFTSAIKWVKGILSLHFLELPFLSCLWNGVDFQTYLYLYTLAPLVLIAMLALPLVAARYRGLHLTALDRNRETQDRCTICLRIYNVYNVYIVYIHTHIHVYTYTRNTYTHVHVHTYTYTHIHIHVYTYMYTYTHLHIYMYICMYICVYTFLLDRSIHVYICMYIYARHTVFHDHSKNRDSAKS